MRDKLVSLIWVYLRGWLVIAVTVFAVSLAAKALSGISGWLNPLIAEARTTVGITVIAVLVFIGPWVIGILTRLILRRFLRRRGVKAYEQMEQKLATELAPDRNRGYRVGLINFPTAHTRSLGVVTATFQEPGTDRELASVYVPGTPDPTRGSLYTVAAGDVTLTSWTLNDLTRYHLTFGSASPDLEDDDDES